MGNTFATLQTIARQALPRLIDNLVFPNLVHKDFSADFGNLGDTIRVRKPVVLTAQDFDASQGIQPQDMTENTVEVKLDKLATVDAQASAIETAVNIDDLNRVFIEPAAVALAEKINADGLALYADVPGMVDCGTKNIAALAEVRKALNVQKVPTTGRVAVWDPVADAAFSQIEAVLHAEKSGSTQALREGSIGRVFGIEHYMSQAVKAHTGGAGLTSVTAPKVNGAVTKGATSIAIDGTALVGKLLKGDVLAIGDYSYTVTEEQRHRDGEDLPGGPGEHRRQRGRDHQDRLHRQPGLPPDGLRVCDPPAVQPGRRGRGQLRDQLQQREPARDQGLQPDVQEVRLQHGRAVRLQVHLSGAGRALHGLSEFEGGNIPLRDNPLRF